MQYFQYAITVLCVGIHANENVTRLEVRNGDLLVITRESFNKFENLQELDVVNSGVTALADDAFHDLPHLTRVNLSGNFIERVTHEIFRARNKLRSFALSDNSLRSIDSFDVSHFAELALLDVSNNLIKELPPALSLKTKSRNFTLIADNNPWDCQIGNWSSYLDGGSLLEFCQSENLPEVGCLKLPKQAKFGNCVLYGFGGLWIGIIAGNLCLIKKILFPKKLKAKRDQSTQFDSLGFMRHSDFLKSEFKMFPKPSQGDDTKFLAKSEISFINPHFQ